MKYGVIDVGGGLRGIYGAGVLDRCLEEDLRFDLCIGVSADSTEGMSTLTKNRAGLEKMYAKGKQDAKALVRWMQNTKQDESVGT